MPTRPILRTSASGTRLTWADRPEIWIRVPIGLYAATEEHPARLHEIHVADGSRVEHRRSCKIENREIPYEQVCRG
ncbi:Ku protein [Streptomyces humi]